MNKLFFVVLALSSLISISGCSYAPGMPGLNVSSSRYVKAQKEGIDYKLIVINAATIKNQKPFDYAVYIANKKKRSKALSSVNKSQRAGNARHKSNVSSKGTARPQSGRVYSHAAKQSGSNFPSISPSDSKANYRYTIGKQDILSITVWDHPELTIPSDDAASAGHVVDNDGRFYFPYAQKIRALGKTTGEIRDELEKKLEKFITNPQISVRVASFRSQKAYVSGAVLKPSTLQIDDVPMTVRDAILKSGGVTPNLFTGYASLARGNRKISIDLNKMLTHNDNRQNFLLKNGDRLHIIEKDELAEWRKGLSRKIQEEKVLNPLRLQFELQKERSVARLRERLERELKSEQAKVFVMGEVNKPGSIRYQVEDGMTLAEAINDSGSLREETVNPKGIFVVRKELPNDTIPTVYQMPLASVHSMFLAEQFTIRPRDIVYVTATPSIRWNRVLAQLIPSLTLVNTVSNLSR